MPIIEAINLCKEFKVFKRKPGVLGSISSFFKSEYTIKKAVSDISFSIDKGELVGYVGPNGAGKSTTIKMLTGILHPSSGKVLVRGLEPHKNRRDNAFHIGVVFGQRSQLYWDLPLSEALGLYKKMYKVESKRFEQNVERFTKLLEMQEFINRPIRQLSLGQKMRAELTVALLHDPEIIYLDEPTIGLDIAAKKSIRGFIKEINAEQKTTVILTTHDMDDIVQVCNRLILIDNGKVRFNGSLKDFHDRYADESELEAYVSGEFTEFHLEGITGIKKDGQKISLRFNTRKLNSAAILKKLIETNDLKDFKVIEPKLEDILLKDFT